MAGKNEKILRRVCVPIVEGQELVDYLKNDKFTGAVLIEGPLSECSCFAEGFCSVGEGRCSAKRQLLNVPATFIIPRKL
ncbi:MAG: hypothetical protein WC503_02510 [Candidatus Shapirobacteria bacterium]